MKRITLFLVIISFNWLYCDSFCQPVSHPQNSWKWLFDGKTLNGWKIYGTEKWEIDGGMIIASSGPDKGYGYLATEKNYYDFILELEFKLETDGNSGVFFRSNLNGTDIKGWQVEVAPPGENTGGIYETGGRGWIFEIPSDKENILKPGKWNKLKVYLKGSTVKTWLNGQPMTDLTDEAIGKGSGKIALQVHSGGDVAVKWRKIRIKALH
jgi:hypothetical protein